MRFARLSLSLTLAALLLAACQQTVSERRIPVELDGETVKLVMRVSLPAGKTESDGPFPTLVLHHGSTGGRYSRRALDHFWQPATILKYFNARGWAVAMPARRGRGRSEGVYPRFNCKTNDELAMAGGALEDVDAVTAEIRKLPFIDKSRVLIGGQSRGGILSIAHTGMRPDWYAGAINFVGGWLGKGCMKIRPNEGDMVSEVNRNLFNRGASFGKETLWLYASGDRFYSLAHSRKNFEAFEAAGGAGTFVDEFPSGIGHGLWKRPDRWGPHVDAYLERLDLPGSRSR